MLKTKFELNLAHAHLAHAVDVIRANIQQVIDADHARADALVHKAKTPEERHDAHAIKNHAVTREYGLRILARMASRKP